MRLVVRSTDSVFAVKTGTTTRTSARGEAVDFDKYDSEGRPNPFHGWTLDFPESVPVSERTYGNKDRAQGWYDDPENEPVMRGTRWGGTGDYADRGFYTHTQPYSQPIDPNRGETLDPSGALGQYGVGDEDLNEYREVVPVRDQTGYPTGGGWDARPRSQASPVPRNTGRERENADDNTGRVFGLWHGGSSYSHGEPETDMESFPSLGHAMRAVEGRYGNYDSYHGGERVEYHPETNTYHLTGDMEGSNRLTPAVDEHSGMEIYHVTPHPSGGWSVNTEDGPQHHIWVNADGDAVVGRERGDYGDDDEEGEDDEPESSEPRQEHLTRAGFGYHPDPYNGDKYVFQDHNGHTHVIRAPNPRYPSDTWRYEFQPHNEQDRDPYAAYDASRDGPRSRSYSAPRGSEQALNLHVNLGDDLSELASRGWGIHAMQLNNAHQDNRYLDPGSNHFIEAHRRDANDEGFDRITRDGQGWHAMHVPDRNTEPVTSIASSRNRAVVLDAADLHRATSGT